MVSGKILLHLRFSYTRYNAMALLCFLCMLIYPIDNFHYLISMIVTAPSVVQAVQAIESAPTEVNLTWQIPQQQNGYIQLYMITFTGEKDVGWLLACTAVYYESRTFVHPDICSPMIFARGGHLFTS